MNDRPIIDVSYGIASSYDDGIEINKFLDKNLRKKILDHEKKHDKNSSYTKKDLTTDFNSSTSYFRDTILFSLKYPTGFVGFCPFMYSYYYKIMTFNWSATIPFLYFGAIFTLFWWLLFGINPIQTIICYTLVVLVMNAILMGLTHRYLKKLGVEY